MKRYRVLVCDFDTRVRSLADPIRDEWEEKIKKQYVENRRRTEQSLIIQFGKAYSEEKKQNFVDLGAKPLSIVAFHNKFFEQARTSFVIGAYYPALVATCALGERILNHLLLLLRRYYRDRPEYKKVYQKESFDDWGLAINTLSSWGILLPEAKKDYFQLMDMRHKSIHFRPETDRNDRDLALSAIICMQKIIGEQFSGFGTQPWFITGIPGEIYIKKEWEENPYIRNVYLPSCAKVGPNNVIEAIHPKVVVNDQFEYEKKEIDDDEFVQLRNEAQNRN